MKSNYVLLVILLTSGVANAQEISRNTKNKEVTMSVAQRNKEVVRKVYEEALNKRNMKLLQEFVSDDFVGIRGMKGAVAFEGAVNIVITAMPDAQWNPQEILADGDKVFVRWQLTGTHTGPFQSFTISGNKISNDGMAIFELRDGKIISGQVHTDRLGFLQQLDVIPDDLNILAKKQSKDQVQFIDKFFVPAAAKKGFYERMSINRNFIKALPGFIEDSAYEYTDNEGNLICITIARWKNREALNKAREAVQAEYKKQGFDITEMFKRLNITADRGIYAELKE